MPISTLKGYPRIGGVIGYGPVGGSGLWKLQERYALADDFYDDVSLLLKMNGANGSTTFLDSSQFGHAVTANGNAAISTTQSVFGGSSLALDGTGDYLTTSAVADWLGESGTDFTVECWFYVNAWPAAGASLVAKGTPSVTSSNDIFSLEVRTGTLIVHASGSYVTASITGGSLSLSTWYHVAVVRSGNDFKLYLDGTQVGSTYTNATNLASAGTLLIGTNQFDPGATARSLNGYIDSLRITEGQARYTAAFTPPQRDFLP